MNIIAFPAARLRPARPAPTPAQAEARLRAEFHGTAPVTQPPLAQVERLLAEFHGEAAKPGGVA
jgi:hypothetical protein